MSKFLYPIYKLKTKSYIKWWLYHKKAGGSGVLSEILEGFSFNLENTLNKKFKLFEIEGNSVQDGTPSPDNEVPILSAGDNGSINEKIINKNLINFDKLAWYPIKDDGTIDTSKQGAHTDYIKIAKNEDYIFRNINFVNGVYYYISYYDSKKVHLRNETTKWVTNLTEINSSDATYIIISWLYISPNGIIEKLNPQLEPGSTATPFVEHKEQDYSIFVQQPFRSIRDVRDIFFKNTVDSPYYDENLTLNGWYERHYIGRYIFTGNEYFSTLSQGIYRFNAKANKVDTKVYNNNIIANALSNYFIIETATHISSGSSYDGHFAISSTGTFDFNVQKFASATELKNWLSEQYANGTPVYVDYLLETPLDLPCTPEQIQQLENLPSTYKDFTIIQSQDETPAYLKIQYYKEG